MFAWITWVCVSVSAVCMIVSRLVRVCVDSVRYNHVWVVVLVSSHGRVVEMTELGDTPSCVTMWSCCSCSCSFEGHSSWLVDVGLKAWFVSLVAYCSWLGIDSGSSICIRVSFELQSAFMWVWYDSGCVRPLTVCWRKGITWTSLWYRSYAINLSDLSYITYWIYRYRTTHAWFFTYHVNR